jgi:hypothetical protein
MMLAPSGAYFNEQFADAVAPFSLSKRLKTQTPCRCPYYGRVIPFSVTAALSFEGVDYA